MRCLFFYTLEQRCDVTGPHIHGTCSACGGWAINYWFRWTHVNEPCAPRREGKWVALHGDTNPTFVAGRPREEAA